MASAKGRIVRWFAGVALTRAEVVSAEEVGGFQRVVLRCEARSIAAGTKVQVLLPSDDMRTYTPIPAPEGMVLLGWRNAGGPGARWMSEAKAGDELPFLGPQRSLELPPGPAVIVGDETSVAVAAAFAAERPGQLHAVLQARSPADVRAAAAAVGLGAVDVVAQGDVAATVEAITARLTASPQAVVALTGGSELIVKVRDALRAAGVRAIKTKTYWIPGRAGLD